MHAAVGEGGLVARQYLDYAERGTVALSEGLNAPSVDVFDSPLEQDVAEALRARGWVIDTQVGVSRYRVDLGVRHPSEPGRYVAGIECDGATYHGAESARDRDIARQRVLEGLGWHIYRVWSPDWYRTRAQVIADVEKYLHSLLGTAVS